MARGKGQERGPSVEDLAQAVEAIAPSRWAEPWDNVGLLIGDRAAPLSAALLCIDLSNEVVAEAEREGCQAVVAYHPPIFEGLKKITAGTPVYTALRAGLAVVTPHTALDVAPGGTNDALCDLLELEDRGPLRAAAVSDGAVKLVVFVPAEALEKVSAALFAAGAGHIGDYHSCSFRIPGTGTFFGGADTQPKVGERGRLEEVSELRLETVVPARAVPAVVRALRASHPYEEPAFDLVKLQAPPEAVGIGRIGTPRGKPSREQLVQRFKQALGGAPLLVAGSMSGTAKRVAVCAGAGGELLAEAMAQKADAFVTGELRHHDALRAARRGMLVICARHSASERPGLTALRQLLGARLPEVRLVLSQADQEPFSVL